MGEGDEDTVGWETHVVSQEATLGPLGRAGEEPARVGPAAPSCPPLRGGKGWISGAHMARANFFLSFAASRAASAF